MPKSRYLEKMIEVSNELKAVQAQKTLMSVIILAVIAVAAYIGISSADSRATSVAVMLSAILGIICIIFLIRYLRLRGPISEKTVSKCEEEIRKNLKIDETVAVFDEDMEQPAFGEHAALNCKVVVGRTFVLFKNLTSTGPKFHIYRGEELGEFKVYYDTGAASGNIGMDLKDKNGKFIRSVLSPTKEQFYKMLDSMEKLKSCANGDDSAIAEASAGKEDSFVDEAKERVANADRKSHTKLCIMGVIAGAFFTIIGGSNGIGFIYAGVALFVISIAGIIFINVLGNKKVIK